MNKLFLALLVCAKITVSSQPLFDEKSLLKNLQIISSDSLGGRRTGSSGSDKAKTFIKLQFQKYGVMPLDKNYEMPFEFETKREKKTGTNLVGIIRGTSETGKYVVISAHYDHEGIKNGIIYNGADDNASGTCALIALTEYFHAHKPIHNIIIVAFDAEELGLKGSAAFVKNPPFPLDQISININMDMVSRADNNELIACGTYYNPELKSILKEIKPNGSVKIIFGHDDPTKFTGGENWTYSSDHGQFRSVKIPFIYFGVVDHADYHKPTDDFEKVNPTTFISCVKLILQSAIAIDSEFK